MTESHAPLHLRTLPKSTPFPYTQLLPLVCSRIGEGAIWAVILPYINEQVQSLGVPPSRIGFYSGLIESTFILTESLCGPLFAYSADIFGRVPVLLFGVTTFALFSTIYGFCGNLWTLVLFRNLSGAGAGGCVVARTMAGEICGREHLVKGFAVFSPAVMIGVVLGTFLGGNLSHPADRFPFLSQSAFLRTYPYALPNIVCGVVSFAASIIGWFTLKETLDPEMRGRRGGRGEVGNGGREIGMGKEPGIGMGNGKSGGGGYVDLLTHRPFVKIMILGALQQALAFSFETLFPLFCYTPSSPPHLGLSLTTPQIGKLTSLSALFSVLMTFFVFPVAHRRLGQKGLLRCCLWSYVVLGGSYFLLHRLVQGRVGVEMVEGGDGVERDEIYGWVFWTVMVLHLMLKRFADMCAPLLDTAVPASLQHMDQLAMANSAVMGSAGLGKALGPVAFGTIFSWSSTSPLGSSFIRSNLIWAVLILIPGIIGIGVSLPLELADETGERGAGEYELVGIQEMGEREYDEDEEVEEGEDAGYDSGIEVSK